jgi:hypothetical protein
MPLAGLRPGELRIAGLQEAGKFPVRLSREAAPKSGRKLLRYWPREG